MKYCNCGAMIISFIIISLNGFSQKIDYRDIQDKTMTFTCGTIIDSSDVYGSMRRLEALDTNTIGKNIHMYYEDLGTCYWIAASRLRMDYLQKAVEANRKALYHKPKSTKALWNIAFSYARLKDCEKARLYFELYAKHTPKKYLDDSHDAEVGQILASCE